MEAHPDKRSMSVPSFNSTKNPSRHSCSGIDATAANAAIAMKTWPNGPTPTQLRRLHRSAEQSVFAVAYPWRLAGCLNRGIVSVAVTFPNSQVAYWRSPAADLSSSRPCT